MARAAGKALETPLILGLHHERILQTVHFFRFMTARDVAYRLYSPKSLTRVRRYLADLAGGADYQTHQYLYRFPLPQPTDGRSEKVYTLGSRGRDFLAEECGLPVTWSFRPEKVKHLSVGQLVHNLTLTRFCCAAYHWSTSQSDWKLAKTRISYELAAAARKVTLAKESGTETLSIVPDAWLLFEELQAGQHAHWIPVLLEIDRGTEYQQKFKQHVRSRIEYVRSGAYQEVFGTAAVLIAYATTGETPAYRETRRAAMCAWTAEVLAEQGRDAWASVFRFCSLTREMLYETPLFTETVWYRPDHPEPVWLFAQ